MARQRHRWDPICEPPSRLVTPVRVDVTGRTGPTRGQARGPAWRQSTYGFYVPSDVPLAPEQRVLEQSMLLPAEGAITGWASLRLRRARFFDGLMPDGVATRPVPLVTGPDVHRRNTSDAVFYRDRLAPCEVEVRQGVRCTVAERAVFDEMRRSADVRDAVRAMDMAAAAELTSLRRMQAYLEEHPGWVGVPLVRNALDLAVEESRSPRETDLRLVWVLDALLPRPLVNREVFEIGTGRLLGIADLLDVRTGLVGEFDGGEHAGAVRRSRDAARDGLFRDHGLEVFRVTSVDLARPSTVVARARAAYARARGIPGHRRTWTLEPPPGWEPALSVDETLTERDLVREMHLAWERETGSDRRT